MLQGLLLYVAKAAGSPPGPPRALGPLNAYELDVDALLQVFVWALHGIITCRIFPSAVKKQLLTVAAYDAWPAGVLGAEFAHVGIMALDEFMLGRGEGQM